ncbi:MAG TPA: cysteine synthase CysM [Casimicrobiaceae bacterium]|nr:cysteine synthase CysM [Casimicrobiaceae bacterium]
MNDPASASYTRTLSDTVGNTPLVKLQRMPGETSNVILAKLEGNNPAGSVKDRPALSMIMEAEKRRQIKPGDTLIEATSGNTGIALAMVAAMRGYRIVLVMPESQSAERVQTMRAYGAEIVLTPKAGGMEAARDIAERMRHEGKGLILDQFANPDNPLAHYRGTGPEIWRDTDGRITHFVSAMGTTGTIMGVSRFLKEKNPSIQIIGAQPEEGSQIPGIRKWPAAYLPKIFDARRVDRIEEVSQAVAEDTARRLAREEGIFGGVSSGGACAVALRVAAQMRDATIVFVVCDRGDRYLSTGVFTA